MNTDRNPRPGQVPLPGFAESAPAEGWAALPGVSETVPAERAVQTRTEGMRRVRRMSNWTAAALIVGAGATTLVLAHNAVPASAPMANSAPTSGIGAIAGGHGTSGPQVAHSVATTSASGVTTTTTTQVVNGKTVVTQTQSAPAYHDD